MATASKGPLGSLLFELKFWVRYLLPTRYVAVFYPSPETVVNRMLNLTGCGPKDTVFDLGCGDGRVLVAAAQRGARAVGYELDADLVAAAESCVREAGVQKLCEVIRGDAAKADVSRATIIALYLSERGNRELMQAVSSTLRPGTKVVSNFFAIEGWERQLQRTCTADPTTGPIHMYLAPGVQQQGKDAGQGQGEGQGTAQKWQA